jgi:hypothetical protein
LLSASSKLKLCFTSVMYSMQEKDQMVKYGLRPHTLKGKLFTALSKIGSCGLKVSDLAKSPQVKLTFLLYSKNRRFSLLLKNSHYYFYKAFSSHELEAVLLSCLLDTSKV